MSEEARSTAVDSDREATAAPASSTAPDSPVVAGEPESTASSPAPASTHPPAARFNAGQKLIFWSVVLGGIALSVSGIFLLFPFAYADVTGMQTAQYVHAVIGVLMVAVIIAHIYIGSLGMEGAYEAMGSGSVDLAWAREHHSAWVAKQDAKGRTVPRSAAEPAE